MPPSAMRPTSLSFSASRDHADRGDLRHADAGDDARRADRAGTDADLDRIRARIDQRLGGIAGDDVAGDERHAADTRFATQRTRSITPCEWPCAVSMTSTSTPASTSASMRCSVSPPTPTAAPTRRRSRSSLQAFGLSRAFWMSLTVIRPAQAERVVDDQHFLDAMLVQQREHFVLAGAFLDRDQAFLARHDVLDRIVGLLLEAQIAVGDDADELLAVDDRHAGDVVARA